MEEAERRKKASLKTKPGRDSPDADNDKRCCWPPKQAFSDNAASRRLFLIRDAIQFFLVERHCAPSAKKPFFQADTPGTSFCPPGADYFEI